mmetsp:Transcript_130209/g.278234  ORF Transcript_130209/g.278234 Transcript_130209/m.278234 type:complete len:214 (-) Transcript_130209:35-676(-)
MQRVPSLLKSAAPLRRSGGLCLNHPGWSRRTPPALTSAVVARAWPQAFAHTRRCAAGSAGTTTTGEATLVRPVEVSFGEPVAVPQAATTEAAAPSFDTQATSSAPVRLLEGAVRRLKSLEDGQQKSVLRLMVNSGGCSGYSYEFTLVDSVEGPGDVMVECDGARLIVDDVSLSFLEGCEIDYVEEMIRSSFQVVKNRLADSKCGCGSSFNITF